MANAGVCNRTKQGAHELDMYLSRKHDELLASTLEPGSYKKKSSLVIVDGFAVEITEAQVILTTMRSSIYLQDFYICYSRYFLMF